MRSANLELVPGAARKSGMELDQVFAYAWTVHDGKLMRNEASPTAARRWRR